MPQSRAFVDVELTWSRSEGGVTVVLQHDREGERWRELGRTTDTSYVVAGVDPSASHEFAAAALLEDGSLEPEVEWERVRVVPRASEATPARAATPVGFAAAQDGAAVTFRWDAADDAATYELREGSTWEDGQLVAAGLTSSPYTWQWATSGDRTYHLKAIDRLDRPCLAAASIDVAIEPLELHVTDDESDQAATWPGTATNLEDDGAGALRLARVPRFGALTVPFGSLTGLTWSARYWPSGTYETPALVAAQVERQRVELDLGAEQPIDAGLPFGALRGVSIGGRRRARDGTLLPLGRRHMASRHSWRMTPLLPVDVQVEIDTSQTLAGAWDGWRRYVVGTYTFRRVRLRITVSGDGFRFVRVPTLLIRRRLKNRKLEGIAACPGGGTLEVTFDTPFQRPPVVVATLAAGSTAVRVEVSALAKGTFEVEALDGSGTSVAADVHWHALGP